MVSVTNPKSTSHPTAETDVFKSRLNGDTNDRFIINADGKIQWGDGSNLMDSSFRRIGGALRYQNERSGNQKLDFSPHSSGIDLNNITDGVGRIRLYADQSVESIVLRTSTAIGNEHGASRVPLIIKSAASQTADLQQWQDSTGARLLSINSAGRLQTIAANEQTTIGAAGTASALPSVPTKYLRVVDSAGNTLAIPAYASA